MNVGDDVELHGLHISPDLDTITYTRRRRHRSRARLGPRRRDLARHGRARRATRRRGAWFNLGDRDLATHLYRTDRLRAGATLSEVSAEIAAGMGARAAPAPGHRRPAADPRHAWSGEGEIGFQEYFVQRHHDVAGDGGALRRRRRRRARRPGVLEAHRRRRAGW